jgi:hypothetical protein
MKKYRILCDTCGYVSEWAAAVPTECPNNPAHTIEPAKTAITNPALYALRSSAQIIPGTVTPTTEDPGWEEIGACVVDVGFIIEDLSHAIGRFVGDFKTSGAGVKLRIVEQKSGESDSVLEELTAPNTGNSWNHDSSVDTNPAVVAMRAGRNRYVLECQLPGGGVTASFRDGALALIELLS